MKHSSFVLAGVSLLAGCCAFMACAMDPDVTVIVKPATVDGPDKPVIVLGPNASTVTITPAGVPCPDCPPVLVPQKFVPRPFAAVPVPDVGSVAATDECGPVSITVDPDVITPGDCPQAFSIARTYHATDACGNVTSRTQTINVVDTTAPVIASLPGPTSVECPATPVFSTPQVVDNCDPNPALTFSDTVAGVCPTVHTRTWTASDACGNVSASVSQTISVTDTVPPVFASFPANTTVECE